MSRENLKKRLIIAYHNVKSFNEKVFEKTGQKLKPYVLSALIALSPSANFIAVAGGNNNLDNKKEKNLKEKIVLPEDKNEKGMISYMEVKSASSIELVDNLEKCMAKYGKDIKIDLSQANLSVEDLELAKGKESKEAVNAWKVAVSTHTGNGRCTRNFKQTCQKLGLLKNMDETTLYEFNRVVPAYDLITFLDAGKVGNYIPLGVCEKDLDAKTMPVPVVRVNEKGETRYAHVQFMWMDGAAYGMGVSASPNGHRTVTGKLQKYGKAHFYVDRNTAEGIASVLCQNKDFVSVLDQKIGTLMLFHKDNIPEKYQKAVSYCKKLEKFKSNLAELKGISDSAAVMEKDNVEVAGQNKYSKKLTTQITANWVGVKYSREI